VPVSTVLGEMMNCLVEVPLGHGGSVLVEVDELSACPGTRRMEKDRLALVGRPKRLFEAFSAAVTPAGRCLISRLRSIDDPSEEAGIVSGVRVCAQSRAIASVAGQAYFTVSYGAIRRRRCRGVSCDG
jgi:hypothetical protein